MKKIKIIINPNSGTGKQKKAEETLKKLLNKDLYESEIIYTQYKGHLILLAKEAAEKSFDAIVVVGGDGSVNEAAQGLIGSKTALGIIPIGSGNGLARHLNIPMSIKKAVQRINQFKTMPIDTAKINEQTFVSIAGIGFDAHVANYFTSVKKRGLWTYAKITVREYFHFSSKKYHLQLDGKTFDQKAFMIVFANANQFGNNFIVSPHGKIDDGLLDVCFIKKPRLIHIPILLFRVLQKKVHQHQLVHIERAKHIELEVNEKEIMNIDGEAIELSGRLHIGINPLSLMVII